MDNIHLLTEKKGNPGLETNLLDARYQYGMVLIGLSLLRYTKQIEKNAGSGTQDVVESDVNADKYISIFSEAISPILLPMISGLSNITDDEIGYSQAD